MLTSPFTSLSIPGKVVSLQPVSLAISRYCFLLVPEADSSTEAEGTTENNN